MGRKTVPQTMARGRFRDPGQPNRILHRPLQPLFADVMAPHHAPTRITRKARGWENVLPAPLPVSRRVLLAQRIGQVNPALARRQVLLMRKRINRLIHSRYVVSVRIE
jgi:hypothetical protein